MESLILLSTAYLAPISYYCRLNFYKEIQIEQWEHYIKQTYRNRCVIVSERGPLSLCIPIEKNVPHIPIKDVRISEHGNWKKLHWQALLYAYKRSPFFEYYADYLAPFYNTQYHYLLDFNEQLREIICQLIGIKRTIKFTDSYFQENSCEDDRKLVSPQNTKTDKLFHPIPYYQAFAQKNGFVPNASIVDLLFNMGPESILLLKQCLY